MGGCGDRLCVCERGGLWQEQDDGLAACLRPVWTASSGLAAFVLRADGSACIVHAQSPLHARPAWAACAHRTAAGACASRRASMAPRQVFKTCKKLSMPTIRTTHAPIGSHRTTRQTCLWYTLGRHLNRGPGSHSWLHVLRRSATGPHAACLIWLELGPGPSPATGCPSPICSVLLLW